MPTKRRRIGVVLGGHLGDVILYSAALSPLRSRFAEDEIILIATPEALELFDLTQLVDRAVDAYALIFGPWFRFRIPGWKTLARWTQPIWSPTLRVDKLIFPYQFVSKLQADLLKVIACHEVWGLTGGAYLGVNSTDWDPKMTRSYRLSGPRAIRGHVLEPLRSFLTWLGCSRDELKVPIRPADETDSVFTAGETHFKEQPFGIIFPGCHSDSHFNSWVDIKVWPIERYAEVIQRLDDQAPQNWMICGRHDEIESCQRVEQTINRALPDVSTQVCCHLTIGQLIENVRRSQFALGVDNGGMHLAIALDIPSVTIVHGAVGHYYFPWGDPKIHRAIFEPMDCWHCGFQCIHPRPLCIESILPESVADLSRSVLAAAGVA